MKYLFISILLTLAATAALAKSALVLEAWGGDATFTRAAIAAAEMNGYSTECRSISDPGNWSSFDLVIFCDGACLPQSMLTDFWHYLNNDKLAVFFQAPAWERPLVKINGRLTERSEYARRAAMTTPEHPIYDFRNGSCKSWKREAQETNAIMGWREKHDPSCGYYYYEFTADFPGGYDYVHLDVGEGAFREGDSVTVFTARGDSHTSSIAVGWVEEDGSRWKKKTVLDTRPNIFYIEAEDFEYASGNDKRSGTKFDPAGARRFFVGLDGSTNNTYSKHTFDIGAVGTCPSSDNTRAMKPIDNTGMDYMSLGPDNAFFDMHDVASFEAPGVTAKPDMPRSMKSSHMRPSAAGYGKTRDWRWLSWSVCRTADGKWRGNPAAGLVRFDNAQKYSRYAAIAVRDREWYAKPSTHKYIAGIIESMDRGVYIRSAGADRFTYAEGQPVTIGADLRNVSGEERSIAWRITVTDKDTGARLFDRRETCAIGPKGSMDKSFALPMAKWPAAGCRVTVNVSMDDRLIDTVSHDFCLWKPDAAAPFVTAKNGRFYAGDKELKFHGVNYHPTCTTSSWNWALFLEWFGKDFYDPEVIERDLTNMNDLGINAVSVQIFSSFPNPPKYDNVTDFLRRCAEHGIYVNLALVSNPTEPDFRDRYEYWLPIIKELRLPEHRNLIAYDIHWEPTWLDPGYRKQFDGDWQEWLRDRYGSVEAAEKIWGCSITRDSDGNITNPDVPTVHRDSPKRGEALAYRRFLEYECYKKYRLARDLYREADPNHLVSFRMHAAGDVCSWYGLLPYSFYYLGKAVDFFAPEAYAMGTTWDEHIKTGAFTRAIAQMSAPESPMVYAEVGYKTIEGDSPYVTEQGLAKQAQYFADFYRMLIEGGVNGVFWWFWPGGYRVLEASDYGIINPDDSDKPVTRVIREMGPRFLASPSFEPGCYLTVDTSKNVDYTDAMMLYNQVEDRYPALFEAGKKPGLRAEARGTDTRTCDYVSVTNDPFVPGVPNPPKYVDGAFDGVFLRGKRLEKGATVKNGDLLEVTIANLNEATWLDGDGEGSVQLTANGKAYTLPRPVKTGERVTLRVKAESKGSLELRLLAKERCSFGEVFTLTVE